MNELERLINNLEVMANSEGYLQRERSTDEQLEKYKVATQKAKKALLEYINENYIRNLL